MAAILGSLWGGCEQLIVFYELARGCPAKAHKANVSAARVGFPLYRRNCLWSCRQRSAYPAPLVLLRLPHLPFLTVKSRLFSSVLDWMVNVNFHHSFLTYDFRALVYNICGKVVCMAVWSKVRVICSSHPKPVFMLLCRLLLPCHSRFSLSHIDIWGAFFMVIR